MTPTEDVVTRLQLDRQSHFACCAAAQNKMLRGLGRLAGTCFVGMDALNALQSVTFDLDRRNGAGYRDRFKDFLSPRRRPRFYAPCSSSALKSARADCASRLAAYDASPSPK